MTFYLFLSLLLHIITSSAAEDWCYDVQAKSSTCKVPSQWSVADVECGGDKQSPIDIVTKNAEFKEDLIPFKFEGYDKEVSFNLTNNGHTAKLVLNGNEAIQISGGGLTGTYDVSQLHFHWGSKEKSGSEHSLNGKKFPIELHIVHEKKGARSEPSGGSTESGSLAVLGFFFNEEGATNDHYTDLINGLDQISSKDNIAIISKVKLEDLIPRDLDVFYRYEGSLTTPPCSEIVTWTVFAEPILLSKNQVEAFYGKIKYSDNKEMVDNFRPIQELNGRTIYTSGVDAILPQTRYLLISLFVFYFTSVSLRG